MAAVDLTTFLRQAGLISHVITAQAKNKSPETMQRLGELTVLNGVQFNVVVRDVLGRAPQIDLVAVTADGEHIIGTQHARRQDHAGNR